MSHPQHSLEDAIAHWATHSRTDLTGATTGALSMMLIEAQRKMNRLFVVVTHDHASAKAIEQNLNFFLGASETKVSTVLAFPSLDTTPFVDVASDRRAIMDRLAVLFHLTEGLPLTHLVVSAPALARKIPPKAAVAARSMAIVAEGELDRERLLATLTAGGYLRVPLVEDAGTFAVRGAIIDIYPPYLSDPVRIETDDYLVMSMKTFDTESQTTLSGVDQVFIHPVRESMVGKEEIEHAKQSIRALCESQDYPSSKTRALIDDVESGRAFFGIDGLLPSFYPKLATILDYIPDNACITVVDPVRVEKSWQSEIGDAKADHNAKRAQGEPSFDVAAHYASEETLAQYAANHTLAVTHQIVVGGVSDEPQEHQASALSFLQDANVDEVFRLGSEDHRGLVEELNAQRKSRQGDPMELIKTRAQAWTEASMRVVLAARTHTQAERLASLLKGHGLLVHKAESSVDAFWNAPVGTVRVVVGSLATGFILASRALVFLTEEEIFGTRAQRAAARPKSARRKTDAFLEDLRELQVGDYVVHADHGVAKYIGLQRKQLPRNRLEELHGIEPMAVEVLLLEYAGGDKLFLPVSRLNLIQKYGGGEGGHVKLDRLGGQTFARTKNKVRKAVAQLAEELLRLYADRAAHTREPLPSPGLEYEEFVATFPFEETADQAQAIEEVLSDLVQSKPMDRLVCGDVGFGKTEVAMRAAFRMAMSGRQVGVMCPTTVLAQQHFLSFRGRMSGHPLRVEVLSRFVDKKKQNEVLASLKDGTCDIVIGTHRLLSSDIHFKNLGLLVVDEEQRFGVAHKERIKKMRTSVDVLTLSATPIPRTLQMAVGGIRDLSLITTAPIDRRAVRTFITRWDNHVIKEAAERELARGGQLFFVYNRIEGLYERAQRLQELLPNARIAVAHGQMNETTLDRMMSDFIEGRFDILCATAIIESGLDIPRANTMIIDRADNFGLSQLYQLRGRVGRAKERAYCYLVTPPPNQMTDEARSRLEALERFTELGSGFHIASLDMELRGAGELLGPEQSGNVAAVGVDLFIQMLEDAVAELRGETRATVIDPELSLDIEHYIPESYIEDIGLRLSLYKRLAAAESQAELDDISLEMEDRFGPLPSPAQQFVRAMTLKPPLRALRILGCDATLDRVTFHLNAETQLDAAHVSKLVSAPKARWRLTPDMRLSYRPTEDERGDSIDRALRALEMLHPKVP